METNLFSGRKISSAYLRMSLPLVLSMAVTLIYNLADTYFVARTNDANLVAGVSLCAPVFTVLMAMGNIFGQGGSSLISRLLGSGSGQGARRVSSFCFYATLFGGVAVGVLMLALRAPLLRLIGADADTYAHASDYFTWLALGAPAVMLSFIHSNLLRSEGMSRESMLGTVGGRAGQHRARSHLHLHTGHGRARRSHRHGDRLRVLGCLFRSDRNPAQRASVGLAPCRYAPAAQRLRRSLASASPPPSSMSCRAQASCS